MLAGGALNERPAAKDRELRAEHDEVQVLITLVLALPTARQREVLALLDELEGSGGGGWPRSSPSPL